MKRLHISRSPREYRLTGTVLAFVLVCATVLGVAGVSPVSAATSSHTGSAPAVHMQLKNSSGGVVCNVYNTPANQKPVAQNCPTGTWTEQLFNTNWGQIGPNKQVTVGQTPEPSGPDCGADGLCGPPVPPEPSPSPGDTTPPPRGPYEGSAPAVHMQLKTSTGALVCNVYNTPGNQKPVAQDCLAGTWTEQLFDSNWGQIGPNKEVTVGGTTNDPGEENLNRKILDGSQAERYWTAEKMEAAKDIKTGQAVSAQRSTTAPRMAPPPNPAESMRPAIPAEMKRRTGRLFFTIPDFGDSSCTGSVVNSPGGDTVWTAGHCVHLNGSWATNVLFVPGYDRGQAPYGTWSARQLWSLYGWTKGGQTANSCGVSITGGDVTRDLGVVILNQRNGRSIVNTVGGNGIGFNRQMNFPVETYAYDGTTGANNDGCDGSVTTSEKLITGCDSIASNPGRRAGVFAVSCPELGPGSSGSGIFAANNKLVGIVSHADARYPDYHYSPLFRTGAINLWNATKDL